MNLGRPCSGRAPIQAMRGLSAAIKARRAPVENEMEQALRDQIQHTIDDNPVVLFMKGSRLFPQCGFSARVVDILKRLDVSFKDVNILADQGLRDGMKEFSEWPTFPQLYVKGQFVGGCDIVSQMFENGELEKLVK